MDVDLRLLMEPAQIQLLVNTLLESSNRCPEDILDVEPHPSDQTLVMLAQLVYTKKKSRESDADYGTRILADKHILDGWKLLITANNKDLSNGYFGAAFAHTSLQQVVVAHRGTDPLCTGAVYTDIKGVFLTKYTSCMNSATTFVEHIRKAIHSANSQHLRHYTLAITGHSLGGWLAQVTTFSVKYLAISLGRLKKNPEVGIHAKTVGFDSPGARDMLDRVLDDYYDRYAMDVFLDGLDITLYLSAPNHINTCGVHLGKIYRIFNDVSNFNIINKYTIKYTLATHAMTNFVKAIIDKNGIIGEVSDWAKSIKEFNGLFKILKWDNNYHGRVEDDKIDRLTPKLQRYQVAELKPPRDIEIIQSCFRVFAEDELQMLYKVYALQEQKSEGTILKEFIKNNNLIVKGFKLFPDFDIDHYNQTITCKSRESLTEFCRRLKQLMRWLKPQFTQAMQIQIRVFPHAADLMYYAEGQSYLDSVPKCSLDFIDSVGFKDFLNSGSERVLCIVTNSEDSAFQMTQLWNTLHQIKGSVDSSESLIKYTSETHYIFLGWSQLQKLIEIYGRPIGQEYMMVVDSTSPSFTKENCKALIDYLVSNSMKLVLIMSQPTDIPESYKFIKIVKSNCNVHLTDLTYNSQKIMFERDNVIISDDKEYSFREFLGNDCSHEVNQILSSECLKKFATIKNYSINIKDTRPSLSDLQMPFFKLNITTCKEFILKCVESPDNNIMVVMSGLNRAEMEPGAGWEKLVRKEIIIAEGDGELLFKNTCNENQDKTIYLCNVSGEDVNCKQIFDKGFYLPRKFLHRVGIDVQKFAKTQHDDLFVICSNEDMILLSGLVEKCTQREKFLRNVQIAATKEAEDDIIQKSFNENIHFVKICRGNNSLEVELRYTHGSVESLRSCASTASCESIDEVSLSQTGRNLVVITDEPGMGKTTSLARLSRLVKSHWVIYIKLSQFQKHIAKLPEVLTTQSVANFLLSECCTQANGGLPDGLLQHLLESKTHSKKLILMFDAFDELDDYVKDKEGANQKIVRLLIFLRNKPTVQIFLTVRKYLKESLEEKLCLFSTRFDEVNREDQIQFLVKFWELCLSLQMGGLGKEERGRLRVYARELLQEAKRVLGPDMDCFMGVPLQLRMLAEVFRLQAESFLHSPELLIDQFDIVSGPKLYKRFITLKLQIYFHDKATLEGVMDKLFIEDILEEVTTKHGELGFRTFFSDFFNKNLFSDISEEWLNAMNRHGLIESKKNGEFQFVHRTYAEYFCAEAVVHWLNQQDPHYRYPLVEEIFLPQILLHPDNAIIRLFMNDTLQETDMVETVLRENAKHIGGLWLKDSAIFKNQKSETALHIAVREKNEHISHSSSVVCTQLEKMPRKPSSPSSHRMILIITQC